MPVQDPDDQYLRVAMMVMLSLGLLAGVSATAIHWLGPVHHPMDRVIPPVCSELLAGLICALWPKRGQVHFSAADDVAGRCAGLTLANRCVLASTIERESSRP